LAVAVQLLDLPRPLRRGSLAAVEQGHLVPAGQRVAHLERAGEAGAAKDQDVERALGLLHLRQVGGGGGRRAAAGGQGRQGGGGGTRAEPQQVAAGGVHGALRAG